MQVLFKGRCPHASWWVLVDRYEAEDLDYLVCECPVACGSVTLERQE